MDYFRYRCTTFDIDFPSVSFLLLINMAGTHKIRQAVSILATSPIDRPVHHMAHTVAISYAALCGLKLDHSNETYNLMSVLPSLPVPTGKCSNNNKEY
jgi:hypothetical protein